MDLGQKIRYYAKRYKENNEKLLDLEKRRRQGEFEPDDLEPDNFDKWKKCEEIKCEISNEAEEIKDAVEGAGLTDYFEKYIYENPEYNLEYEWEKLNNQ